MPTDARWVQSLTRRRPPLQPLVHALTGLASFVRMSIGQQTLARPDEPVPILA